MGRPKTLKTPPECEISERELLYRGFMRKPLNERLIELGHDPEVFSRAINNVVNLMAGELDRRAFPIYPRPDDSIFESACYTVLRYAPLVVRPDGGLTLFYYKSALRKITRCAASYGV